MSSTDHLPHKHLKLGGVKFLRGLILWRGKIYSTKDISAVLSVTPTYFREVYDGKYCAYKSALNYYKHKSDMEVTSDYIRRFHWCSSGRQEHCGRLLHKKGHGKT